MRFVVGAGEQVPNKEAIYCARALYRDKMRRLGETRRFVEWSFGKKWCYDEKGFTYWHYWARWILFNGTLT